MSLNRFISLSKEGRTTSIFDIIWRTSAAGNMGDYEDMSSTSQKHRNFVSEPMGDKGVNELAGIGEVLSKRLEAKGFDKAYVVLGQFLVLKKHRELFVDWMRDICSANTKQAGECYQCISDWCDEFL